MGVDDTAKEHVGLDFKDFELFNLALWAKQAWRILQCPESLSARILKSVYFLDASILTATLGSHPSQIWRAIVEGRDILKQGMIGSIGNGNSTHIWTDNWIPRKELMWPYGARSNNPQELDPT